MITVEMERPDIKPLMIEANDQFEMAELLVIDDDGMYEIAGDTLKEIKTRAKELDEKRKKITKPMDVAKKEVMDLFRPVLARLSEAEAQLKTSMGVYKRERDKQRAIEASKAAAAARAEREQMEAQAAVERDAGNVEEAERLETEAVQAVPQKAPEKVEPEGVYTVKRWVAHIENDEELVRAVADGVAPMAFVTINVTAVRKHVQALDGEVKLPGVRIEEVEEIRARAAA